MSFSDLSSSWRPRREKVFGAGPGVPLDRNAKARRRDLGKWLDSPYNSEKHKFFKPLAIAWELLIYDRLEPGSADENIAGIHISDAHKVNPTIQLNQTQLRMIGAVTEVAGIPML